MLPRINDAAAATATVTAPVWAPWLTEVVNPLLTTLSLILGILFLAWRWRRAMRRDAEDGEE